MPTPTANRVLNALRYAQRMADISIVYGGAGLGKTLTARRYQEDNPNVWIATMTPSVISVTACLERVAYAVGVNGVPASASRAENAVISRVEGTGGLIVIDEAQHLPVTCLDALSKPLRRIRRRAYLYGQRKRVHAADRRIEKSAFRATFQQNRP